MKWLNKILKKDSSLSSSPGLNTHKKTPLVPPWILYPEFPPGDGFWRQGGEPDLHSWLQKWQRLNKSEREKYLKEWTIPKEWKEDFFEHPFFAEWVYSLACDDILVLSEELFSQIIGQRIAATLLEDSCLCITFGESQKNHWKLSLKKTAWQLIRKGMLESASLDDSRLIEKRLSILQNIKLENITFTNRFHELTLQFSEDIEMRIFTTQAILDDDSDQWKLEISGEKALCAGPGMNLRYEINSPLLF